MVVKKPLNKNLLWLAVKNLKGKMFFRSGNCGVFAVALNRIMGGKGKYIAVYEDPDTEFITHVALKYGNILYDSNGVTNQKNLVIFADNGEPDQRIIIEEVNENSILNHTNWDISTDKIESELRKEINKISKGGK